MKRIIFKNSNGGVSVIVPAPQSEMTISEIAAKDVPAGRPYKIVNARDIPSDRTFRDAWEVDEIGADYGVTE